jgi:hypothetical protein
MSKIDYLCVLLFLADFPALAQDLVPTKLNGKVSAEMLDLEGIYVVNKLKIPAAYVRGFDYFAVDNGKFTKILDLKIESQLNFLLGELAMKYNQVLACESQ